MSVSKGSGREAVAAKAPAPARRSKANGNGIHDTPPIKIVAAAQPVAGEPEPDRFRDLLGQAVGLRMDAVTRTFRMGEVKVEALREVSLEIAPGEFVAISGPSGCGKSTLLGLLGGLDRPSSGHVYAAGTALDQIDESSLSDYRLQRVGTVFQSFNLVPNMTAADNVALPLVLAGVAPAERRRRALHLLELVGLSDRADFRPSRLSGGDQQRVAVARALANRPGLVLADEPTGNLDSASGMLVLELLRNLNRRGATVVLVTHDPEVARTAHRTIKLRDGRLLRPRSPRRTMHAPELLDPPTRLEWRDALRAGLRSVARRPLRTALTAAGVAMGIGVMALIMALAVGLQSAIVASGPDQARLQEVQVTRADSAGHLRLDPAALAALRKLPHVSAAWGQVVVEGYMTTAGDGATASTPTSSVLVSLAPPRYQVPAIGKPLLAGRLPRSSSAAEVILSQEQARLLGFSPGSAIGRPVKFTGQYSGVALPGGGVDPAASQLPITLTVVGVSAAGPLGVDVPGGLIPYDAATSYWAQLAGANGWQGDEFQSLTLYSDSAANAGRVRDEARAAGFPAQITADQQRGTQQLLLYLELALVGLGGIALVVACLGIVNTMYTAVLERTREIGVLKAVGSRRRDILLLFIAEAALIGAAGGLAGVVLAAAVAQVGNQVINRAAQGQGVDLHLHLFQIGPAIVVGGVLLAVIVSTASGLLPALRAARLDPVGALRYE